MERINKICIIISLCIISFSIGTCVNIRNNIGYNNKIINTDTIYNQVILDSIKYNIFVKDSIIIKLKRQSKYETEQAINANDSIAIEQFKELSTSE